MSNLRILHYTFGLPPRAVGGEPLYVQDLVSEQRKLGYNVSVLLPKQTLKDKKSKVIQKGMVYYLESSLPVSSIFGMKNSIDFIKKYDKRIFKEYLEEVRPDIIHIHTFMGLPKEFLEVAKKMNIKLIYTTHDFYGICLKSNLINGENKICSQIDSKICAKCNIANGLDTKMMYLISTELYKKIKSNFIINKLKTTYRKKKLKDDIEKGEVYISDSQVNQFEQLLQYYRGMFGLIDQFHFNSTVSKEVFKKYLPNIEGKVISITLSTIEDNRKYEKIRKKSGKLQIGYIGRIEPYKGINILLDALEKMENSNIDFECNLYGDNFSIYDKYLSGKVHNRGNYARKDIKKIFENMDVLVLPSIWFETFGFVVLEALSYGVPVIVSKNVGAKDVLENLSEMIISDSNSLYHLLCRLALDDIYYTQILRKIECEPLEFDMLEHSKKIIEFYGR